MFYSPEMLQTYTEEDLTMADLALSKDAITLMPGTRTSIEVICTAVSGLQTNVASACRYEVANPHVATIDGGVIRALEDGSTTATISYTDAMGNNRQLDFRLTVTTFPLTADAFNPSIYSTGKYNEKTQSLTTGQYGFGGWEYPGGLDLSAHKYLVVKLKARASCGPSFRLFDENNYWSSPHMTDFGNATSIRINLTTAKRDDGKKLDPKHIYIAGFWSYGGSAIQPTNEARAEGKLVFIMPCKEEEKNEVLNRLRHELNDRREAPARRHRPRAWRRSRDDSLLRLRGDEGLRGSR